MDDATGWTAEEITAIQADQVAANGRSLAVLGPGLALLDSPPLGTLADANARIVALNAKTAYLQGVIYANTLSLLHAQRMNMKLIGTIEAQTETIAIILERLDDLEGGPDETEPEPDPRPSSPRGLARCLCGPMPHRVLEKLAGAETQPRPLAGRTR